MDPQNLMSTLQQLSNLSGANLTSQIALNQFGNDLSSLPWTSGHQTWLDSAKMAAMYNIIQTASVNDQVQQLNTINAMSSLEQSLKLLAQQNSNTVPQSQANMDQLASAQSNFQHQLAMETMLQNGTLSTLLQQQQQRNQNQVSTPTTSLNDTTNLAQLLQMPHSTSATDFLTTNLQNTMSSILGLTNTTPSSSALPTSTEQELFNAAANHLNSLHGQIDPLQNPFVNPVKKASQQKIDEPTTSQQESVNQAQLLSKISQNNLLISNPVNSTNEQTMLPSTSNSTSVPVSTPNNPFIIPTAILNIDDFDFNDLHDIFLDKPPSKELVNKQDSQSGQSGHHVNQRNEHDLDTGEFDFDEKNEHAEKLFDSLKFLTDIGGDVVRNSPEPGFNQAELEPVQFTPPDSPHFHPIKLEALTSPSSSFKHSGLLQKTTQEFQKHQTLPTTTSQLTKPKMELKNSMPLIFIPPVQKSTQQKSMNETMKKSTLLQRSNKVPIYKQKFVNLTSGIQEKNGEDCYSFMEDDFDLPLAKVPTSSAHKEHEPIITSTAKSSGEKQEKQPPNASSAAKRLAKLKEHKEPRHFGIPWFSDFLERQRTQPQWTSVNPFEPTDLDVDETPQELEWTADRANSFKKSSIRLVIKEEPAIVENTAEEAPRPRLVLKFFKPKTEESANTDVSEHHEDKHSKKHKKHKRKQKDDDYDYPGEIKKHKKDKKHRHKRHRVKSENVDFEDDEDTQPAYNTRSALSVKTENSEHASPAHSTHSFASSSNMNTPSSHKQSTSNDLSCLITGRLMDEQFTKRYKSFAQTQSDLPKGIFVVSKDEIWKDECPIWRIDSQNLLQKFVACDENPGCYTNTSNYTGWCDEISENYIIIHVQFLKQTRAETIVKPLHPLESLFPALPSEDPSIVCGDEDEESVEVVANFSNSRVTEMIASVVELLLRQCSDPTTLQEVYKSPDSKHARSLQEFQRRCLECVEEIQVEEMIRLDLCMLLDRYHGLITFEHQEEDDECLGCGSRDHLLNIGLHGVEKYDPNLLTIEERVDIDVFGNAMDFPACEKCADQIQFYHRNRHSLFHLFKQCENQFIDLALERPSATSNALLNLSLKDKDFIKRTSNEIVQLWSELPDFLENVESVETVETAEDLEYKI